jgi:hypothetical protein
MKLCKEIQQKNNLYQNEVIIFSGTNKQIQIRKKKSCGFISFSFGQINFWLGKYFFA